MRTRHQEGRVEERGKKKRWYGTYYIYVPDAAGSPAPSYTSVNAIMNTVYLGWLVRGVHFWSANLLVVMIVLHMARVFWTGSYRAPRELNWMVGVIMLLIILAFSLTGYLLPWDTKAYWATSVTIKIAAYETPFYSTLSLRFDGDRLLFNHDVPSAEF